jgi:hypothetical protein
VITTQTLRQLHQMSISRTKDSTGDLKRWFGASKNPIYEFKRADRKVLSHSLRCKVSEFSICRNDRTAAEQILCSLSKHMSRRRLPELERSL